jgi:hypothetical protein
MKEEIKNAVETYQCPGCTHGSNIKCFAPSAHGEECGKHSAGTFTPAGRIFLGLGTGFNRVGPVEKFYPQIFKTLQEGMYNKFNIPAWKHLDANGNTLVRGIMPRRNEPFLHIYLGDFRDQIDCLEITQDDINEMD